ncbi:MAG TPA: serine/threonine-protein kinase [Polyangiales bacterium]|nr:serine/threonine-protein kinase [Polyangiales bacterium]
MPVARTTSRPVLRASSTVDRYVVYDSFAQGGMATVHLARLDGAHGFRRTVAVKRLLPNLLADQEFALMLVDEARLAARIRHHNVVSTLDVVRTDSELLLVMEYVHGESLVKLARLCASKGQAIPLEIACAIVADSLHGLHAAHEAKSERGEPLEIVHRDVSPQNILIGADGVARIVDFGIAKAAGRAQTTRDNVIKGKLTYMAPEQIEGKRVTRATDVFAASIVLWELLTGDRLFLGRNQAENVFKLLSAPIPAPSTRRMGLPPALNAIVQRGLERDPLRRFSTAEDMALALESALPVARPARIARWVNEVSGEMLAERAKLVSAIERAHDVDTPATVPPIKRRRTQLGLLAAAGALGLAGWLIARGAPHTTPVRAEAKRTVPALPTLLHAPVVEETPTPLPVVEPAVVEAPPAAPAKRTRERPRRAAPAPASSCDPPYTLDGAGRTLFKAECM